MTDHKMIHTSISVKIDIVAFFVIIKTRRLILNLITMHQLLSEQLPPLNL